MIDNEVLLNRLRFIYTPLYSISELKDAVFFFNLICYF
jgi:hypothetical protein